MKTINAGMFSLGIALSVVLSYSINHSILWAIFHGWCSWVYVIYFTQLKESV